eukprot:TRINITY_DN74421_c0_g1_i1.p1 TRINITY_DN74421_c0_g1~~TRINITY_DN74421_c0_g1_i1.p1  ORF type:complete len:187 (+),score=23.75 TRINITY_DN74421_c0_g1_i1:137-697(+)
MALHPSLHLPVPGVASSSSASRNLPDPIHPEKLSHLARRQLEKFDLHNELHKFRGLVSEEHFTKRQDLADGYIRPQPDMTRSVTPIGGHKIQVPPGLTRKARSSRSGMVMMSPPSPSSLPRAQPPLPLTLSHEAVSSRRVGSAASGASSPIGSSPTSSLRSRIVHAASSPVLPSTPSRRSTSSRAM